MPELVAPSYAERVFFVGANGSGKTYLAAEMLRAGGYERALVIDLKRDFPYHGPARIVTRLDHPALSWDFRGVVIFRPSPEDTNGPALEGLLKRMYHRSQKTLKKRGGTMVQTQPMIIYLDEGLLQAKLGASKWLAAIAVAGRSLGIGLWVTSQRPTWIPVEIRSEAWRWYVFFLNRRQDEKEIIEVSKGELSYEDLESGTQDYWFWEIRRIGGGRMKVEHFPPIVVE